MTENTYDPHAAFQANLQKAEADMKQAGLDPKGHAPGQVHQSQQATPTVNQALLEKANAMQSETDENGRRRYHEDSAFRAEVEAIRMEAFGRPAVPVAQQQPTQAQAPTEVVAPQGSPSERLSQHLENGGIIAQGDLNEGTWNALTADYKVDLPEGYVLDGEHVDMLHNARAAGITQDVINRYIAEALKE